MTTSSTASTTSNISVTETNEDVNTLRYISHKIFINKPKNGFHKLTEWQTIEKDIAKVTLTLKEGRAIIPALIDSKKLEELQQNYKKKTITIGGKEEKKDWSITADLIESSDLIAIDYDTVSVNELSDLSFIKWSFYGYATPSGVNDPVRSWTKHRWLIKLPETVPGNLLGSFRNIFLERYATESDRSVATPHQMIYGRKIIDGTEILKEDLSCVLDEEIFSEILAEAYEKFENDSDKEIKERSEESLTAKVDNHYYKFVDKNGLAAFIETVFPDYAWELKQVSNDSDTIEKYVSRNPFSETNSSGSSLCWMLKDDGRIMFIDRANKNSMDRNIVGNFHEFCILYREFDKLGRILDKTDPEDKVTLESELKGSSFQQLVARTERNLGLDSFNFRKARESEQGDLARFIKIKFDKTRDTSFFYYDLNSNVWKETLNSKAVITQTVIPYYKLIGDLTTWIPRKHPNGKPLLDENGVQQFEEVELDSTGLNKKASKDLEEIITDSDNVLYYYPERNNNYIGFQNGDFNLETKILEPFNPDNMIFARFTRDYEQTSLEAFNQFRDVFSKWFQNEVMAEIYLYYLCCILMNQGKDIMEIIFFIGEPGSAKSTMATIAERIYRNTPAYACVHLSGNDLNAQFGIEDISSATQIIVVEELKSLWGDNVETRLKNGWGRNDGFLRVEGKRQKINEVKRNFGLICDRQDFPFQDSNDSGYLQRIIYLKNPWQKIDNSYTRGCITEPFYSEEFKPIIEDQEQCWEFFLSILCNVSCDEAKNRFNELKKHDTFNESRTFISESNDHYLDIIRESVQIIEGDEATMKEAYVTKLQTFEVINRYFVMYKQQMPKASPETIMKNFRKALYKEFPQLKNVQPPQNKKKINGKTMNVICGIRYNVDGINQSF